MKYIYLWVDDVRKMPGNFDVHAFTYDEAINHLKNGNVLHVSLDHDLGTEKTGYDIAAWIEQQAFEGNLPRMTWAIHSANPVGRSRMEQALQNADKFWKLQ